MGRTRPAPGSRAPLSRDRVLRAAFSLADRDGIEALTMRKLANELGVGAMSLYYHVPNKDELVDGMVELVWAEMELPSVDVNWKAAMKARANAIREVLRRHPWAVGLMESSAMPGPASLRQHNAVLGCLRSAGFSVEMTVQALSVQDAYIYGFALQEKTLPFETREESAQVAEAQVRQADTTMPQWATEYPYLAEVVGGFVAQSGYSFGDAFAFGLDAILDSLERLRVAA